LLSDIACAPPVGTAIASRPATAANPNNVLIFIFMNTLLDEQALLMGRSFNQARRADVNAL
jgi:hypothetical protein